MDRRFAVDFSLVHVSNAFDPLRGQTLSVSAQFQTNNKTFRGANVLKLLQLYSRRVLESLQGALRSPGPLLNETRRLLGSERRGQRIEHFLKLRRGKLNNRDMKLIATVKLISLRSSVSAIDLTDRRPCQTVELQILFDLIRTF